METYKIYLINKETEFDSADVFGVRFKDLALYSLGGAARIINSEKEIEESDYVAVIYSDTPLVTKSELDRLFNDLGGDVKGYKIGDGYIKQWKEDYECLCDNLPFKVTKVKDVETYNEIFSDLRDKIMKKHLSNGVVIHDPMSTSIDINVEIGKGSEIHSMVKIKGGSIIGEGVKVYSFSDISDTIIGDGSDIRATYAVSARIGQNTTVGPFAVLRKGAIIGDNCRVGDFVEIKNSVFENDVKAAHLAYVGDSYVGENTNVGCGVVFANYDGKVKKSVVVGKNVFIGANTNLVAPLEVEDGAYIAAGSTVTQNVPVNSLCIARARQVVKNEWERPSK